MEEIKKGKNWLNIFVIAVFVILYALTSSISMIHIVDFFELSNSTQMSWIISIAFEVGAAASLAALTILDKLKKELETKMYKMYNDIMEKAAETKNVDNTL